ncbi:MAG: hypothetical protein IJ045_00215 [Ruminiclostridium sp.]|nr:hypothetical protein [Ruminiclostridium sp.]
MKKDKIIYDGELTKEENEELAKQYFIKEEKQTRLGKIFIIASLILLTLNTIITSCFYPLFAEDTMYFTFVAYLKDADMASMRFILQFVVIAVIVLKIVLSVSSIVCGIMLKGARGMIAVSSCIIAFIDLLFSVLLACDPNTYSSNETFTALIVNMSALLISCAVIYMSVFTDRISAYTYSKMTKKT